MARTIFALLIGIDDYPAPIPRLQGCVNDIDAISAYLQERVAGDKMVRLEARTLKNGEATRKAVVAAFQEHLGQAAGGDVALLYYSGHGSQEPAPEQFWTIEPDHLDETLVLYDSREPGSWDLADKELAKLIGQVAANGPHVAVILDCCHSGSGTRGSDTVVRRAPTDLRQRPIETFLVTADEAQAAATRSTGNKKRGWDMPPAGRHVLMAACRDDQEAKEYSGDGKHRGAFSFFLGQSLRSASGVPTYRDLFTRTSALLATQVSDQSAQLETAWNEDLDATFLDGLIRPAPAAIPVQLMGSRWVLSAGAASGIPAPSGADAARVALYAFDAPAADLADPSRALAMAHVAEVLPTTSRLAVEQATALDPQNTYKAVIISLPVPPLGVVLEGQAADCALVRHAIATSSPEGKPSLFIIEAKETSAAEFRVLVRDSQYTITRPDQDRPLVAQIDGLDAAGAKQTVERLEHMARWNQTARLANPATTIEPGAIKLSVLVDGKEVAGSEIRLEYQVKKGKTVEPGFQVSLTNTSNRRLFCGLLDLTQRFQVSAGLIRSGCVKLEPGETAWANDGQPITANVPDELWKQGVIEYKDLLKLIVCTEEFDPRLLEQPRLDMPRPRSRRRHAGKRQGRLAGAPYEKGADPRLRHRRARVHRRLAGRRAGVHHGPPARRQGRSDGQPAGGRTGARRDPATAPRTRGHSPAGHCFPGHARPGPCPAAEAAL